MAVSPRMLALIQKIEAADAEHFAVSARARSKTRKPRHSPRRELRYAPPRRRGRQEAESFVTCSSLVRAVVGFEPVWLDERGRPRPKRPCPAVRAANLLA